MKENWHIDYHSPNRGLALKVTKKLYEETSDYQTLEIIENPDLGTVMLLDGVLMLGSEDEFVYHEMLALPSLYAHPNPLKVLIIGGGDCGTMTRVLSCDKVKRVVQVEIDEMVTRVAKIYYPELTKCLADPRAEVIFGDGLKFIQTSSERFDLIMVDSTDPVGPAAGLFRKEFFTDCYKVLADDGILTIQSESPWIPDLMDLIVEVNQGLKDLFTHVHPYLAGIQSYQAGLWMFQMASKIHNPKDASVEQRIRETKKKYRYFNEEIYSASFALPQFVKDKLC
nr:spermidine synthase [Candidatus Cloacimonadota bacterium]